MKVLENIKLDKWYGIILYLGILLMGASFYFKVDFIEEKYLFGLGIGLFLIGISNIKSEKYEHHLVNGGMLSTKIIKHSPSSILILIIGLVLTSLFGFLIIKGLI